MFPLPPCWDPLPSGPPTALAVVGFPLLLVALLAVIACAIIVGIDMARNRAPREAERTPSRDDTRVIEIRDAASGSRAAAGGRR
jgi:hypothetical protein